MKREVFNAYVDKICHLSKIQKKELFSKNKRGDLASARHLLYFLCYNRPMTIGTIQGYMKENGYSVKHPTIIYGIKIIRDRMKEDADYVHIAKEIERCVVL